MPTSGRLGLALSGGALKASAHVGILSALNTLGIYPDVVAGTSAGSFVAAAYAQGLRADDFTKILSRFPGRKLLDYGFPLTSALWNLLTNPLRRRGHVPRLPNGLLLGKRLQRYVSSVLTQVPPGGTAIPFHIIATDLWTGKPVTFTNDVNAITRGIGQPIDDLAQVIVASCSLPGIFTPVNLSPWLLADGACRHYVPVRVLQDVGCDKVIAVNLYRLDESWTPQSFAHVLSRSYDILLQDAVENDMTGPNVYVLAPDVGNFTWVSFDQMEQGVQAGEATVHRHKEDIIAFLERPIWKKEAGRKPQNLRCSPAPSLHINGRSGVKR
ncbi:patatin-like phospholipase family protein [Alicyclobacillus sp. ALC3]|uniref:patatin-like phospholipase family protein n=1 Tax=Alicyclobacillus sp. ALC3 TaxID=2796143 RepID=UPI002378FB6F|nr:patatin-like phospholipase family protein [Alicyclobacillus sp. ALC3]WDL97139.1 patatin-like phospholipase family protein [Alicyclobacillus sp. ALC3]